VGGNEYGIWAWELGRERGVWFGSVWLVLGLERHGLVDYGQKAWVGYEARGGYCTFYCSCEPDLPMVGS
jgi:hypothetical protein